MFFNSRHRKRSFRTSQAGLFGHNSQDRLDVLQSLFANGFPYSRSLLSHTSCINALAFSNGDGRFLASGGDDLKISLWDFHQEDVLLPMESFVGPRGNIFTIAFSSSNRYLWSGGLDSILYKYDISYTGSRQAELSRHSPDTTYSSHEDTIREIACHPTQDEICLTGSEDGTVIRHDGRVDQRRPLPSNRLQLKSEVTGVKYHPTMEHMFLTSEQNGIICLRDERMTFGTSYQRSQDGIVQLYSTKLTRKPYSHLSFPEPSSICMDRDGTKFTATFLYHFPTIYSISDPNPIAICSGKFLPDGSPIPPDERTYSNACTMKHGSFGGPGLDTDEFYASGSDDFRGYIWRIPPVPELLAQRQEVSNGGWENDAHLPNTTAFTMGYGQPKYIPLELSTPLCRLTGHNSIVNTVIFHPHFLHVVTSGVERFILLHSATTSSPCTQDLRRSPTEVRRLSEDGSQDRIAYYQALMGLYTTVGERSPESEASERRTISMFDHILREEGDTNVFEVRAWADQDGNFDSDSDLELL